MAMEKLAERGHIVYLCLVRDVTKKSPKIKDIPIVCEFPYIFSDEIPGLHPMRELEFTIE